MLVKQVTYTNLNNEEKTETLYFNMNAMEEAIFSAKYLSGEHDTIESLLDYVKDTKNYNVVVQFIRDLIVMSYGFKTVDGGFAKTKEATDKFESSLAAAEIFTELFSDTGALEKFALGIKYRDLPTSVTQA